MATKSTAKKPAPAKAAAKPAAKAATPAKKVAARPAAKPTPKGAAKPAAKAATKVTARPLAKPVAKAAAKSPAKPAAKPAARPAAKVAAKAPAKGVPAKAAAKPAGKDAKPPKPALRAGAKPSSGPSRVTAVPAASSAAVSPPKPIVRPIQAVSPKDLVAAHEYLLSRSAGRSHDNPVTTVDGVRLPTEEQMLAMGESEYMGEKQLAFFRHRLHEMERELLSNAGETTEHLRETVIVPDPADRATIEEEHALELRTRDRERKLLKKVQASLQSMESGEYGYCEETGDPIGIPRLLARPTATLSLEAQQRREIKQKLFGD
jgi:DnaK suppressor protein